VIRKHANSAVIALIGLLCAITLVTFFVAVPFYSDRSQRAQQTQQDNRDRVRQQVRTQEFLHMFDCTYGASQRTILRLDIGREQQAQSAALAAKRINEAQHQQQRADLNQLQWEQAHRREAQYRLRLINLPVLDGVRPCDDVIQVQVVPPIPPEKK
jgi:hypothetical protein